MSRRGGGRPLEHDWRAIDREIVRRCINSSGLVVPKNASQLARKICDWYEEKFHRASPSHSEVREVVGGMLGAMREALNKKSSQ